MASIAPKPGNKWLARLTKKTATVGEKRKLNELVRDPATGEPLVLKDTAANRKIVLGHAQELERKLNAGEASVAKDTVEAFGRTVLDDRAVRSNTTRLYFSNFNTWIAPHLGSKRLTQVAIADIEGVYALIIANGNKPSTVDLTHTVLKKIFGEAKRQGIVASNVLDDVKKRAAKVVDEFAIGEADSDDDVVIFDADLISGLFWKIDRLDPCPAVPIITLCYHAGLRRAEAAGLKWENVDLDAGTISIKTQLVRWTDPKTGKSGLRDSLPKSARSLREIDLSPELVAFLRKWRTVQIEGNLKLGHAGVSEYVAAFGPWQTPDAAVAARKFVTICDEIGSSVQKLHGLRHLHLSGLVSANLPIAAIAERGGHSVEMLLANYVHARPEDRRKIADFISAA